MMSVLYNRHKETLENFSWRSLQMFSRYGVKVNMLFAAAKLLLPEEFGLLNYLWTVIFVF
jgi:hypothetical protein